MNKGNIAKSLFAFLVIGVILPSFAAALPMGPTVDLTFTGVSPGVGVSAYSDYHNKNLNVAAGIYNLELGGDKTPYDSFCIDFFEWAPNKTYEYDVQSVASVFNAQIEADLYELWDKYFDDAKNDSIIAAAMQVAIWEVTSSLYYGDTDYSVETGDGGFYLNNDNNGVQSLAQTYLDGLNDPWQLSGSFSLIALTNVGQPGKQDYLVSAPVPEPSTMLLMGAGLLGTLAYRRKKLNK